MNLILAVVGLFAIDYYGLRTYLRQRGKPADDLAKKIILAYRDSIVVGVVIMLLSLPLFLVDYGNSNQAMPYLEELSFWIWTAGFVFPLPFFMKRRLDISWPLALGLIFGPLVFIVPALYSTF